MEPRSHSEAAMGRTATLRAKDLTPEARRFLAGVLHVDLSDPNEVLTVTLHEGLHVPSTEARAEARTRLLRHMSRVGEKAADAPDEEIDAAIEEALQFVRARPKP